jgi:hypothetical protein
MQLALGRPSTGVTDHSGSAADQHDRPVARPLEVRQSHDGNEVPDVQARCAGVKAGVAADGGPGEGARKGFRVLMEQPTPPQLVEQIDRFIHGTKIGLRASYVTLPWVANLSVRVVPPSGPELASSSRMRILRTAPVVAARSAGLPEVS